MMNDRARLWSKRKSAPFADPRDEERALREMRKLSLIHISEPTRPY